MNKIEVKERPILFSAPMVRAILDGSKTQTRRVAKEFAGRSELDAILKRFPNQNGCPYGQPGDRLWVRETFGYVSPDEYSRPREECNIEYRADLPPGCTDRPGNWPESEAAGDPEAPRWRPSIHMPRAASRILLEIVSVRVERLQDISDSDAYDEGTQTWAAEVVRDGNKFSSIRTAWKAVWGAVNGAGSWDANPWVWVVEFKRVAP